jgi:hypothetical protein
MRRGVFAARDRAFAVRDRAFAVRDRAFALRDRAFALVIAGMLVLPGCLGVGRGTNSPQQAVAGGALVAAGAAIQKLRGRCYASCPERTACNASSGKCEAIDDGVRPPADGDPVQ